VEVRSRNGDIEINDLKGGVEVSSDNAAVRVQNIGGSVRLDVRKSDLIRASSVKGNVEVDSGRGRDLELEDISGEVVLNGSYSGDMQIRNLAKSLRIVAPNTELRVARVPGEIHMDLGQLTANNLAGPIHITSSRARDVQLEQFTDSLEMSLDHGDITLRPMQSPLPKIDARTRNGQIDLALPAGARFDLKAVTRRGEVSNDFGSALKLVSDDESGHRDRGGSIIGTVGQGPQIVVQTDRGSVTVRKDSGTPLIAHSEPQEKDKDSEEHERLETEKH
jgi:DUF4097 and DUF4098 domain-containing protein YvlB